MGAPARKAQDSGFGRWQFGYIAVDTTARCREANEERASLVFLRGRGAQIVTG